ncbi:methyl-accepting chemotaxis protein [Tepidibacter hydrothermalis]|uniref:Methyl-accepting chemotaxis protein n=1 Tax=Tepidibacter hydrothermalis TaxID=3036126 RepID=A0ABY8EI21_9FIRM|nr:methyl-accepting chemotaxis protein [Tepidibacter hydrothermalis]WFD11284.1 methyl-accepting chemotaxis protein [Tepidibacter hydrothermalis]
MIKKKLIKSLKSRLIICFLIVAIIPAITIGELSYYKSEKSLQKVATDQLIFTRDTKKKEIEDYFKVNQERITYMAQEPSVVEAMEEFTKIGLNSSSYDGIYEKYNPTFANFIDKLGHGDVMLVDSSGNVLYSAFKEDDFGTNLLTGPYKDTNIAKAYDVARNSNDKDFTTITDYEFYSPSNEKPILGIASPIFKGEQKIGVLIFKMGTEEIDKIVSNNNNWESLKLGKSGEVVLIGQDYKLRSNTRFVENETDEKIKAKKSAILLKEIRTKGTAAVVTTGETAVDTYFDYHGVESIVAYTPLNINGLKWDVLVKIDEAEAFQSVYKLKNLTTVILIVAAIVITIFSIIISSNIATPLIKMANVASRIATGDLTVELEEEKRSDEIGILTKAIRNMLKNLKEQTKETINVVDVLAASVNEITVSLTQVTTGAAQTSSAVSETTATVEEVKQTVYVSSEKTKNVSNNAKKSLEISKVGNKATEDTLQGMNVINSQMQEIAESILGLSEQSQNISELIESVDTISEQSNILAVNASIEAAKAGEHGKGFSIVAQEIRNLAEQSKQGTKQIRNILRDIQKAANTAVMTTEKGIKLVDAGMKQAGEAGYSINQLVENINLSAQAAVQIEASSQQQLIGMDQVAIAMEGINEASIQNVDSMKQLEEATNRLQEMGYRLKQLNEKYKV